MSFGSFAFCYGVPQGYVGVFGRALWQLPRAWYRFRPLALLGLPDERFYSSDYFPLVPWLFLFVCGFFLWRALERLNADRFFRRGVPVLSLFGRYSLWIYMIHQPLLMGICLLLFGRM